MELSFKPLVSSEQTVLYFVAVAFILLVPNVIIYFIRKSRNTLPIVNPKHSYELTSSRAVQEFTTSAKDIIYNIAAKRFGTNPFRVNTDFGEVVILRPQHADEIRNDKRFSFLGQLEIVISLSAEVGCDDIDKL